METLKSVRVTVVSTDGDFVYDRTVRDTLPEVLALVEDFDSKAHATEVEAKRRKKSLKPGFTLRVLFEGRNTWRWDTTKSVFSTCRECVPEALNILGYRLPVPYLGMY